MSDQIAGLFEAMNPDEVANSHAGVVVDHARNEPRIGFAFLLSYRYGGHGRKGSNQQGSATHSGRMSHSVGHG